MSVKKEPMKKREITINEFYTEKSTEDKAHEKILQIGNFICALLEDMCPVPTIVMFETPTESLIYGNGNRAYLTKRASNVCKVNCLLYYVLGKWKKTNKIVTFFIEPNQWQVKKEIKKFKNSKEWSIDKAAEIIEEQKFSTTSVLDEHNADALCMGYLTLLKSFNV